MAHISDFLARTCRICGVVLNDENTSDYYNDECRDCTGASEFDDKPETETEAADREYIEELTKRACEDLQLTNQYAYDIISTALWNAFNTGITSANE